MTAIQEAAHQAIVDQTAMVAKQVTYSTPDWLLRQLANDIDRSVAVAAQEEQGRRCRLAGGSPKLIEA